MTWLPALLQLVILLPDMLLRLERIKADLVLQLVQDPQVSNSPNTTVAKELRSPAPGQLA